MSPAALRSTIHMTLFRLTLRFFTPMPLSALNDNDQAGAA